jgi:hypothetical protein
MIFSFMFIDCFTSGKISLAFLEWTPHGHNELFFIYIASRSLLVLLKVFGFYFHKKYLQFSFLLMYMSGFDIRIIK